MRKARAERHERMALEERQEQDTIRKEREQ